MSRRKGGREGEREGEGEGGRRGGRERERERGRERGRERRREGGEREGRREKRKEEKEGERRGGSSLVCQVDKQCTISMSTCMFHFSNHRSCKVLCSMVERLGENSHCLNVLARPSNWVGGCSS